MKRDINDKSKAAIDARLSDLEQDRGQRFVYLRQEEKVESETQFKGNIENYIGMASMPVGLAGPLLVNGFQATGKYHIPLATTEGALVASYARGMKAANMSGGVNSYCIEEKVQRSPLLIFANAITAIRFSNWVIDQQVIFQLIVSSVSNYAKIEEINPKIQGNHVILELSYTTGDASGQNMVTLCSQQIMEYIERNSPWAPHNWYIESNHSGDKKATMNAFVNTRGKRVVADLEMDREVVSRVLKSSPEAIHQYWTNSTVACVQSGAIGAQGHFANGLTALFIATGQDVACVSESSVGITRMEISDNGGLYVSVTLPNLMVGTVGGGTGLPSQRECLEMMECFGPYKAKKFAEICAATVLCGEVSIAAALAEGHFTQAHFNLGRK